MVGGAHERLGTFLEEEEERLDRWREDAAVNFDQKISNLRKEISEKKKRARTVASLEDKVALNREAKTLSAELDKLQHQRYIRMKEIDAKREHLLDEVADQLQLQPEMSSLFSIRWEVV